jgi:hypothetical protein
MIPSTPGRRVSKEYAPRNLRLAMAATRMANACGDRHDHTYFRYIVTGVNIHEAVDPDREILILDSVDDVTITVPALLDRLPEDLRKRVLSS